MTNQASITALLELIQERRSFVISSHTRPDGDAIGSSLGLMHLLEAMGKHAVVAFTDAIPDMYRCLPGVERIQTHLPASRFDAAIFLECDSLERSSFDAQEFSAIKPALTINIDHHRSGQEFANFNWIDAQAPAVGAMIYDLTLASGLQVSSEMATCLYAAVLTDTGSFAYAGVTSSTFGMAEHLVECGADPYSIAQAVFFSNTPAKVRLLGTALSKMHIEPLNVGGENERPGTVGCDALEISLPDAQIAWCAITVDDIRAAQANIEDCEGLVSFLIGIAGVEAAIFLRELPSQAGYRLSLRSKGKLDIATVAQHFGGGGHRNASGCSITGTLDEVIGRVIRHLHVANADLQTSRLAASFRPAVLLA